ncbi:MAG TPA: threonine--tRNA ligase, partial [Bacteroidetes bacterium]|nr:threonine--tRNA ligase [Bacteroidota bacterium]
LDFSMPERFELEYVGADGQRHRPVMIHRAIFGSIERFIAQIIEHHGGRFPFWLSPVQIAVLPLTDAQADYADAVTTRLKSMGFRAELDSRSEKIGYKIREAETGKIPYMLILGPKEVAAEKVAVRKHGDGDLGQFTVDELITKLHDEFNPVNSEK